MPVESSRTTGALSGDGEGHHVRLPVRKQRLSKSKDKLAKEAARVLHQADKIECVSEDRGVYPEKFYTLPRGKNLKNHHHRSSEDLEVTPPPKKPPRSFAHSTPKTTGILNIFNKKDQGKKSNLKRSVSDASYLKINNQNLDEKKQLSPIIEDYSNKENVESVTDKLKEYIDEIDSALLNEEPRVFVIDVDRAEKISGPDNTIGKKFKSLVTKRVKNGEVQHSHASEMMIHSSQKPAEKIPLTRGFKVDSMVKRLSTDNTSPPPPRTNIMVTPNIKVAHNNNQPFSYTRGQSPDRISPVIYAHVVCDKHTNGSSTVKQTVHAAYSNGKKHFPHSDSDEGLGNEESPGKVTGHLEDPITPKFQPNGCYTVNVDSSSRGRGDGMDAKRRESLTEPHENGGFIQDLSTRRDLLESRINSRTYYKPVGSSAYRQGSSSPPEKYQTNKRQVTKYTKLVKDRELYKSNPEITRGYEYHEYNSLRREKDKLGDSGIENDFKRDAYYKEPEYYNESEDEGFASSLLIASERQHTEENVGGKNKKREYDSDRSYREAERKRNNYRSKEYAPRERSIDDGSHYDPRIDKDVEFGTLKKLDKKPPKPEKKSGLEMVKQLFTRDSSKKKKEKQRMVPEENLRARYVEYKGSRENLQEPRAVRKTVHEVKSGYSYNGQRSLSASPSPPREDYRNGKTEKVHTGWFKSLDRLAHKKNHKIPPKDISSEDDLPPIKRNPTKNLRFFGDTDIESNDSIRHKPSTKTRSSALLNMYGRSQSNKDLRRNISEERRTPPNQKMHVAADSDRDVRGSRLSMKPPMSPNHRYTSSNTREVRGRRRRNEVSSVESSEGDSSQQSQRSVVYLHAATVGDIPGPGYLRNAKSREELASNSSSAIQPQVKTLSRSFSVLAPWRPRHVKESYDIDYTDYTKPNGTKKYEQRPKNGYAKKESSSTTLKKKAQETKRSNGLSRSKESLNKSKEGSTLYKKKERQPKENNTRYTTSEKRIKSMSVESLGRGRGSENRGDVSRSVSMPRDPQKSAGWFSLSKNKKSSSMQRL